MKTRHGFVSNSSSSSFLVAMPPGILTADAMCEILFPGRRQEDLLSVYDSTVSYRAIAQQVFSDYQEQTQHLTRQDIANAISDGWYEGKPEFPRLNWDGLKTEFQQTIALYDAINKTAALSFAEKYQQGIPAGFKVFLFGYGDENGDFYGLLEHGDIFKDLHHLTISHH